jgi:lipopolysaccharide transport system permease protein
MRQCYGRPTGTIDGVRPTVITPPRRLALPPWRELWEAREVALRFGQRDVVLRYRQTFIGVAWVLIQPLASAGIFSIVFGAVAQLPTGGVPYFLFSFMSMLAWTLFAGTLSRASSSLVANQALVSKVFFPRMLVPLSTMASTLLDFAVGFGLGIVLLFVYRVNPGWAVLLVPLWVVLFVATALGVGLAASAWMVKYRDVQYVLPWVLQVGLFATPVAYALDAVPEALRPLFLANPLTWMIDGFRWSVLGTAMPPAWQLVGAVTVAVVVFFLGTMVFQRHERVFADLI